MKTTAKIVDFSKDLLILRPTLPIENELIKKEVTSIELRIDDGRTITAEQRRKTYAIIAEIAEHTGYFPEEAKEWMKFFFIGEYGILEKFSLSDCSVTTAREFINYLIDFCIKNDVPCKDSLLNLTDDINSYLYQCLINKKCCVTGQKAEFHHCEGSRVGMGRNRKAIVHLGAVGMPLCRQMHDLIHKIGEREFCERYHVYGIKADEEICKVYSLKAG